MTWQRELGNRIGTAANTASKNKSIVRGIAYHNKVYKKLRAWQPQAAPDQVLYVEPWLRDSLTRKMCQPDAVLVDQITNTGIVIEVKMNWKDGRDEKLIQLYLEASKQAFGLDMTWPALITSCVAGYIGRPRLGLGSLLDCADWQPGQLTPVVLVP